MEIFNNIGKINSAVAVLKSRGLTVGFVPTMGALHKGHLSLLQRSKDENDISLCSIFVNPIQFNNKQDLEKYPRSLEEDCRKLEQADCDIVFAPTVDEMYPEEVKIKYDFGQLDKVMEGKHRPGHFNGMAVVVKKLFDICLPHRAYFGEKDFQQLMIVRELVKQKNIPVQVIGCGIIREDDGLAMSSRNRRLSPHERSIAPEIYKTLLWMKHQAGKISIDQLLQQARQKLTSHSEIKIEYVEITDEESLLTVDDWDSVRNIRALIALFLGEVRLIDNMRIK
ncbi:MAG: pantoate--beta-alanine ligase [Bacteroidetes bacterium]|nr:pantoate--beta-alanine ligase [Bacteroidota bacterium]